MLISEYEISTDINGFSFEITSPDYKSCEMIYGLVMTVFLNEVYLFKATGLPSNLNDLRNILKDSNSEYFEGDEKKFLIRRYPELLAKIDSNDILRAIIFEWDKTIYERRFIYVVKPGCYEILYNQLKSVVYVDEDHFLEVWPYVYCTIENMPEADNHATFLVRCKTEYQDAVKDILNNFTIKA